MDGAGVEPAGPTCQGGNPGPTAALAVSPAGSVAPDPTGPPPLVTYGGGISPTSFHAVAPEPAKFGGLRPFWGS